jgi:flavin reductase (DIM6/NTAB) family NADH-FMN oxidoreductase RutF
MSAASARRDEPIDVSALRRSLGSFVTGVTVVTTVDSSGAPHGLTANSFTSVSLDPPLVLVCVNCTARCHDAFATSRGFVVHILGHDQDTLAATFASPTADRWTGLATRLSSTGAPLLRECLTWLDCVTTERLTIGDHLVVVGRVAEFSTGSRRPLAYCQGSFLPLDPESLLRGGEGGHTIIVRWLLDVDGQLALSEESPGTLTVPSLPPTRVRLDDDALVHQAQETFGVRPEIPMLYSIFDDDEARTLTIVYRARATVTGSAPPPGWTLVAHDDVPWPKVIDSAIASMVQRYVAEHAAVRFGIYAGSVKEGRVAVVAGER